MYPMHKYLMDKAEWYEHALQRRADELGYGELTPSIVSVIRHMHVGQPARMALLAQRAGTTRRRISQIAAEGVRLGVMDLIEDPSDKRVLLVRLSAAGEQMGQAAIASMHRIEAELARRIGRANLERLVELLAMDWGPEEVLASDALAASPPVGLKTLRHSARRQARKTGRVAAAAADKSKPPLRARRASEPS